MTLLTRCGQPQGRIWKTRLLVANSVLMLAAMLMLHVGVTQSARAQTFTVLYSFTGEGGSFPQAGLVRDAAGNLYSTTANSGPNPPTYGTVFKVRKTGKETVLYNFTGGRTGDIPTQIWSVIRRAIFMARQR